MYVIASRDNLLVLPLWILHSTTDTKLYLTLKAQRNGLFPQAIKLREMLKTKLKGVTHQRDPFRCASEG